MAVAEKKFAKIRHLVSPASNRLPPTLSFTWQEALIRRSLLSFGCRSCVYGLLVLGGWKLFYFVFLATGEVQVRRWKESSPSMTAARIPFSLSSSLANKQRTFWIESHLLWLSLILLWSSGSQGLVRFHSKCALVCRRIKKRGSFSYALLPFISFLCLRRDVFPRFLPSNVNHSVIVSWLSLSPCESTVETLEIRLEQPRCFYSRSNTTKTSNFSCRTHFSSCQEELSWILLYYLIWNIRWLLDWTERSAIG